MDWHVLMWSAPLGFALGLACMAIVMVRSWRKRRLLFGRLKKGHRYQVLSLAYLPHLGKCHDLNYRGVVHHHFAIVQDMQEKEHGPFLIALSTRISLHPFWPDGIRGFVEVDDYGYTVFIDDQNLLPAMVSQPQKKVCAC